MNVHYPIPDLGWPLVSYCQMFNSFENGMIVEKDGEPPVYHADRDEIKKIRDLGEALIFDAAKVGSGVMLKETRDSTIAWLDDNPQAPALDARRWLISRMQGTLAVVNRDKFQLDLDDFAPPQYTKYGLNQHYNWHVDVSENSPGPSHRKLSIVTMLTEPDEYEGGELELNLNGNPDTTMLLKPAAGTSIIFYSHVPHRVRPVTSGNRASLVAWALGPKLR